MTITVTRSVSTPTALGNPGDEVQITEECSGKTIRASLDELGAIPRNIDLASNERWNVSVQGMQVATLAPPRRMLSDPKAGRASEHRMGPVIAGGAQAGDVAQGAIGNCYLVASLAALAHLAPDQIADMIHDNGDGTYTVRFFRSALVGDAIPEYVTIDADFIPAYEKTRSHASCVDGRLQAELWPAIIQKAWAAWEGDGDYEKIGDGGRPSQVLEALTGRTTSVAALTRWSGIGVWRDVTQALDDKRAVVIQSVWGDSDRDIVSTHVYSVLAYRTTTEGDRELLIRNPWGNKPPVGSEPNGGAAWVKLDDVVRGFAVLTIVD